MSKKEKNAVKALVDDNSPLVEKTDDEISIIYSEAVRKIYKDISEISQTDEEIEEKTVAPQSNDINTTPAINNNCIVTKRLAPSLLLGVGTGLAMMPVFNHLIKQSQIFGKDIHNNDYAFTISTINTCVVYGITASGTSYYFLKSKELEIKNKYDKILLTIAKIAASCSVLVPLSLLWVIEIENQKTAKSQGFDAFLAWASFTSLPLLTFKCIDSCKSINKMYQNILDVKLDSAGSKFFVYTPTALSLVGRFIAYYSAGNSLSKTIGVDDNTSIAIGITSGVVGSLSTSIFEFTALKSLFKKQTENFTVKKLCASAFSILEGAWLSIPVVSIGITATEGWNPFTKTLIFTPLFLSSTASESLNIYEVGENIYDSLMGCCGATDSEDQ